MEKTHSK